MKNLIIGIITGLLLNGAIVFAQEKIVINPLQYVKSTDQYGYIYTTKVSTPEGMYRIFVFEGHKKGGITAVKIK